VELLKNRVKVMKFSGFIPLANQISLFIWRENLKYIFLFSEKFRIPLLFYIKDRTKA